MSIAKRRVRDLALSATMLSLILSGCRDEPLEIPGKPTPAAGGEASAGEASGGDGAQPSSGGSSGTAGAGATSPLGGNGGKPPVGGAAGIGGIGGTAGMGGKPNLKCGDGNIDADEGEECDDGNKLSGDGCSAQCKSACETCEKNVCLNYDPEFIDRYPSCYEMKGTAVGGPAEGISNAELCRNLVDCVRRTECARRVGGTGIEFEPCYCQYEPGKQADCNDPNFVRGPCYREFQEASAQDGIGVTMWGLLTAVGRALGNGYGLLYYCDSYACRDECLPAQVEDGEITTITADMSASANEAGESALGNLIADAQRSIGQTDIALVDPRAIAYDLAFAGTAHRAADADGRVLWSELLIVQAGYYEGENPNVGNGLRTMTITGQQIYDALEEQLHLKPFYVSGLAYRWDGAKPPGSRLIEVTRGGVAIDKKATFSLTTTDVVTSVALSSATNVAPIATTPFEALVDYLKGLSKPVAPPALDRITRLN